MKHLKLFENNISLKKYLVDDDASDEGIYLWKYVDIDNTHITLIEKDFYDSKEKHIVNSEQTCRTPISRFKRLFNIVYQSDSYKDAKNMFLLLVDANKYNL